VTHTGKKSSINTTEETHLTSNVSFEDRRIDINIKIHPFLQHTDDSLKLGNVSQDLQGEQDNRKQGLEVTGNQRRNVRG